ncbi:hypothetical protein PHYPO_G00077310 [Pangasianodon hypophthalmus]|uniref:Uncharacterized protein n=1 Tax=Pangasianodon hypophthalmus TaxID=310915 RepID=A0A5N5LKN0_PANHP|nr:hypothetical protein PHYPO_G00077310 [Pangasianodon hypophthalmus]
MDQDEKEDSFPFSVASHSYPLHAMKCAYDTYLESCYVRSRMLRSHLVQHTEVIQSNVKAFPPEPCISHVALPLSPAAVCV